MNGSLPRGVFRFSFAYFLIALVVLIVTAPFVDQTTYGDMIEAGLVTIVLLSAVLAIGGRRQILILAVCLFIPAVVGTWLNHLRPNPFLREIELAASTVFVAFVIVRLLDFILRASWVNAEVMCAGVSTYLMLGLLWAFVYSFVDQVIPNSFAFPDGTGRSQTMARFEALYFSFCTLTTVGFGDIVPTSNVARMLTMVEATIGVFFIALLIARLVSLYSREKPDQATSGTGTDSDMVVPGKNREVLETRNA